MLERYAHMYTGKLGTIKSTENRIDLKPDTVKIHQRPHRAGSKEREVLEEQIENKIDSKIIETAQT